MSTTESLLPHVRDDIHFNSLLEQATESIEKYACESWCDKGAHDPGITFLEAFGYGVADLAYRQTLPLTDLLTPPQEQQVEGGGIFPPEFGPQQALTCGPISEDDYRRALLDLHSTDTEEGYFFFCNAQLIREPDAARYRYWYNTDTREYSLIEPDNSANTVALTLRGNYHLYLMPARETQDNPDMAQTALDSFLLNHRNFGEYVSKVIWLTPENLMPEIEIVLDKDISQNSNIAAILADVYRVSENYVTPSVLRYSAEEWQQRGGTNEDIYQGPRLQHGWIPQLPLEINGEAQVVINLSGLATALLAINGVKGIRTLGTDQSVPGHLWLWETSTSGRYPLLWGDDPLSELALGQSVRLLGVGDVQLTATKDEIKSELTMPALIHNAPLILPYGQWRDTARYHPASDVVPPCYDLFTLPTTQTQTHLHQFLLTFEQILANNYQQQALLPTLLTFQRQGDKVWGSQWPFAAQSMAQHVHGDYRDELAQFLDKSSHDRVQELRTLQFLLTYFNSHLAPDVFLQSPELYLLSQQGYLSRHSLLTYNRANTRIAEISALQQRIAAKLGLGGESIFDNAPQLGKLPFYLVEHRQLLPAKAYPDYDSEQTLVNAHIDTLDGHEYLTLSSANTAHLVVGQLVDVSFIENEDMFTIRGQMIKLIDPGSNSFSLSLDSSKQLSRHADTIISLAPERIIWKNSAVWLQDMDYSLVYSDDQMGVEADEIRLNCMPFPVMAVVGEELSFQYQISAAGSHTQGSPIQSNDDIVVEITAIDRIRNTIVVRRLGSSSFPSDEQTPHYRWHFSNHDQASSDRFSFMLSAVFDLNSILALSSDPYATEAWVKEIILAEIPSHIGMLIHWMPKGQFSQFGILYERWQHAGLPLGDDAFDIIYNLTLGQRSDILDGIGNMVVATPEQQEDVIGLDGNEWHSDVVIQDELFYVPEIEN